jgi:hypothetical protein
MPDAPATPEMKLPDDPALLPGMFRELLPSYHQMQRSCDQLEHRLEQLLKLHYGPRADKLNPNQGSLFSERTHCRCEWPPW